MAGGLIIKLLVGFRVFSVFIFLIDFSNGFCTFLRFEDEFGAVGFPVLWCCGGSNRGAGFPGPTRIFYPGS